MEPTDHNRRAFDDAHRTAENVLAAPGMPERIRERLHGASGSRVLHLLCGTGRESVDLAELGALVTGVDDDASAIEAARRRQPELPWVHADVHALPPELLLGRWDLVYLGYGSLARLRALDAWAAGVAAALRPGGVLLLHDEHPAGACLDAFGRWRTRLLRIVRARRARHRRRALGLAAARARGVARQGREGARPPRARGGEARSLETGADGENVPMGIAVSILLIAVGAVLTWGVTAEAEGLNVNNIGVILMIVGLLGLVISMIFWSSWGGVPSSGHLRRGRRRRPHRSAATPGDRGRGRPKSLPARRARRFRKG